MIVLGNGESRKGLNLESINDNIVGCNALCRDFDPDHLVCVDQRMVSEALNSKCANIYTRRDWLDRFTDPRVQPVPLLPFSGKSRPDDPWNWGSGPYAVLIASCLDRVISLIGFDLYSTDGKINNLYKNTANYDNADKRAVDPRYWIYQIGRVFKYFDYNHYTVYCKPEWNIPAEWKYFNVQVDNISNLL